MIDTEVNYYNDNLKPDEYYYGDTRPDLGKLLRDNHTMMRSLTLTSWM